MVVFTEQVGGLFVTIISSTAVDEHHVRLGEFSLEVCAQLCKEPLRAFRLFDKDCPTVIRGVWLL
eukprot:m.231506 g.231506  ORF g.231506 m.231506 type:complete len:65 (+) comp15692_c0_seq3:60-254(+)